MWPNFFTGFPFLFPTIGRANFNTLPTVAVTVGTENVTLELVVIRFQICIFDILNTAIARNIVPCSGCDSLSNLYL